MHLKIIVVFFHVYFMGLDENETWNNICFYHEHKFEGKTLYTVSSTELFKLLPVYVLFSVL